MILDVLEILINKGFEVEFTLNRNGLYVIMSKNKHYEKIRLGLNILSESDDPEGVALAILCKYYTAYTEVIF